MEEELIKNGWHPDFAKTIKDIFDKHSRESCNSTYSEPAIYEDDIPLVVEELNELFLKLHQIS